MKNSHQSEPLFFSLTYEFLEIYLPKQCGRSPHTVESYRDALSLFRRYILEILGISVGKFTFAECTRECVLGFMNHLSKLGSKPSTRNQRLAALKSYMAFAANRTSHCNRKSSRSKGYRSARCPRRRRNLSRKTPWLRYSNSLPIPRWA